MAVRTPRLTVAKTGISADHWALTTQQLQYNIRRKNETPGPPSVTDPEPIRGLINYAVTYDDPTGHRRATNQLACAGATRHHHMPLTKEAVDDHVARNDANRIAGPFFDINCFRSWPSLPPNSSPKGLFAFHFYLLELIAGMEFTPTSTVSS